MPLPDNIHTVEEAVEAGLTPATILAVSGSHGSGLATVVVDTDEGPETLYCDNGPLIRALDAAFGDVIQPGHTFDVNAVRGRRIAYMLDDMGFGMEGFVVLDEPRVEMEPLPTTG